MALFILTSFPCDLLLVNNLQCIMIWSIKTPCHQNILVVCFLYTSFHLSTLWSIFLFSWFPGSQPNIHTGTPLSTNHRHPSIYLSLHPFSQPSTHPSFPRPGLHHHFSRFIPTILSTHFPISVRSSFPFSSSIYQYRHKILTSMSPRRTLYSYILANAPQIYIHLPIRLIRHVSQATMIPGILVKSPQHSDLHS